MQKNPMFYHTKFFRPVRIERIYNGKLNCFSNDGIYSSISRQEGHDDPKLLA